jgi:large subunit ribosomal protein L25
MAGERVELRVSPRERRGSREARRLRREGMIPGVLYGPSEPQAFSIPERDLRRALSGPGGTHAVLDVVLQGQDGSTHASILKDFQRDPVKGFVTHIDLHEIRLDRPIQASVSVQLTGEPAGVREGGVLQQSTQQVNIEALPLEVPEHIDVDASELAIGEALRVSDLPDLDGVTYLDDPETAIASVALPTLVEEPEEELAEGEEAEPLAEGEEAPEGAAEAPSDAGGDAAGSPGTTEG